MQAAENSQISIKFRMSIRKTRTDTVRTISTNCKYPASTRDNIFLASKHFLHHSLGFGGAALTPLDFAFCAFKNNPMGSRVAETAVPHDDSRV